MGGPHCGSNPADGGWRNLRGWSARLGTERLSGLRDPNQQARWRRLAAAGGGAPLSGWVVARSEDALLLGLTAAGLALFVGPLFLGPAFPQPVVLFSALVGASALVVLGVAVQTHRLSTRLLAVLAALVAIDATLRLVIVIGLLGFSPIFFLIIAGGFVMGPSFGFASGALALLLSAVLTAGLGPWLPYQMLAAGWVGMGAGYLGRVTHRSTAIWAIALLRRFGGFYLATSLAYDTFRAAGNLVLIGVLGPAVIRALDRFRRRFLLDWAQPVPAPDAAPAKIPADVRTPA